MARALRFQAQLPEKFWGECVLASCYLINRTSTRLLENKSPFETLFWKGPSYELIREFGCLCYGHNQWSKGDKFDSRGRKCILMGYPFGKKGWQLFDLETREFFVSRDVRFHETVFPYNETVENVTNNAWDGENRVQYDSEHVLELLGQQPGRYGSKAIWVQLCVWAEWDSACSYGRGAGQGAGGAASCTRGVAA